MQRGHWFTLAALLLLGGGAWWTSGFVESWTGAPSRDLADIERAVAANNRGERHAEQGRVADALRLFEEAIRLDAHQPVSRYNWAMVASSYRKETQQLYNWSTDELLRRSLAEFRAARDLSPRDFHYSRSYAEMFYLLPEPQWDEAYRAWTFCLQQPLAAADREQVVGRLARICMQRGDFADAENWLGQLQSAESVHYRRALERKLAARRAGEPDIAHAGMMRAIRE